MSWRDDGAGERPGFVNDRHRILHYAGLAREVGSLLPHPGVVVLDHGCGEALSADRLAAHCAKLYLCDAPPVRARLAARFGAEPKIAVVAPEDVEALPDHGLDLIVATSLVHRLAPEALDEMLGLWHSKLTEDGRLVLGDVIPHEASLLRDAMALLRFASTGGFLAATLLHLARGAFADSARPSLTQYGEDELIALLRDRSFAGCRSERNIGHDQSRMTFVATPV